ncbi:MAG: hypothetical protein ACQKBV_05360 [Puniceicoccales bacterium]
MPNRWISKEFPLVNLSCFLIFNTARIRAGFLFVTKREKIEKILFLAKGFREHVEVYIDNSHSWLKPAFQSVVAVVVVVAASPRREIGGDSFFAIFEPH